jgi:hypothetical protein
MRKRARTAKSHQLWVDPTRPSVSRTAAMAAFGEVVYAARVGPAIKIGHTANLGQRYPSLAADELLGFRPGTYAEEQAIHTHLKPHRLRGREYYHETAEVIDVVNSIREFCRLEPLAA